MSLRQLARLSGVSNAYISQVETGERGTPSPDVIKKLSRALNVPYEDMMKAAGHIMDPPVVLEVGAADNKDDIIFISPEIVIKNVPIEDVIFWPVKDDAMSPKYLPGDVAVIRLNAPFRSGDVYLVMIGEKEFLRRIYALSEMYLLHPTNPSYEPVHYPQSKVEIIGTSLGRWG
jgi:transcriptional regulator with XRE-family HTH domain